MYPYSDLRRDRNMQHMTLFLPSKDLSLSVYTSTKSVCLCILYLIHVNRDTRYINTHYIDV